MLSYRAKMNNEFHAPTSSSEILKIYRSNKIEFLSFDRI